MNNPIREIVERSRLSPATFAIHHGISLSTLRNLYYGYTATIPNKIKVAITTLGYEIGEV